MNNLISPQDYQSLRHKYQQLEPLEKAIVRVLALFHEVVSRTDLVICINHLHYRDSQGAAFVVATIKPVLERLQQLGLVEQRAGVACARALKEIAIRDALNSGVYPSLVAVIARILGNRDAKSSPYQIFNNEGEFIREVRMAIYQQDWDLMQKQFEDFHRYYSWKRHISLDKILLEMVDNPFDIHWVNSLNNQFFERVAQVKFTHAFNKLLPSEELLVAIKARIANHQDGTGYLSMLLAQELCLRGNLTELQELIAILKTKDMASATGEILMLEGNLACLRGEYNEAIAVYKHALKIIRKLAHKRGLVLPGMAGVLFALVQIGQKHALNVEEVEYYLKKSLVDSKDTVFYAVYEMLYCLWQWQQGDAQQLERLHQLCRLDGKEESILFFFKLLCAYWSELDHKASGINYAQELQGRSLRAGYHWWSAEVTELLNRWGACQPQSYGDLAQNWRHREKAQTLLDIIQPQRDWELSLQALLSLANPEKVETNTVVNKRLAWFIIADHHQGYVLVPREQSWRKTGGWTAGRAIALKNLDQQSDSLNYLTPQDRQICTHLECYPVGYYGRFKFQFKGQAFVELVGHPLVFWDSQPPVKMEVVRGEPELLVQRGQNGDLLMQLQPDFYGGQEVVLIKESLTRLKVIAAKPQHQKIAAILGKNNRLQIPSKAQEQVLDTINSLASMVTIHSHIGGNAKNIEIIAAHNLPHIHLLPLQAGLKVAILTRPFGAVGPYFPPGQGGETVITEIDGRRYQTQRNLLAEEAASKAIISACPMLDLNNREEGEWYLEEPEHCLELLLELQILGEQVKVEWPEGEKLRVKHRASFSQLKLNISRQRDWFNLAGELHLDDQLVLGLQQLLELLEKSSGRFIPLGEGQFLALTQEFRQRLEELRFFSEPQGQERRFHPLRAPALEDWLNEVEDLKVDRHWQEHLQKIAAMQAFEPQLPSTLQADLRDYQIEGFQWLARLAHWGVGACLADDMGLGKTLQALALILTKAAAGPTLIVAPTSVCPNWLSETRRFAPTLNPFYLGSGDRALAMQNLKPFDLVICTYGLLQQEGVGELLAQIPWQVVVLDEAQAIKNMATKRSQAAMALQAKFKLITTGTPIENHLGELWNLFRFINPGLLGSLESFNERFANPIERYQDKQARHQLKRLIQPFLLRRTKNQVLQELPARTEILLQVELGPTERAFYEALRRQAIAKLENVETPTGNRYLQVLAEIMRLRRACCHPRLVKPDAPTTSSKLEAFGEILEELLENRHKALVFSQFVDHLTLIRTYLDQQNIHYQYLDGSTPQKERQKRVDAFQNGIGDIFLISLKAGGTGLNLTAADYVIHMDPWWNPAVEDQASDRAHRIGQQRPVTIYRLVTKNTIEEKILELHRQKRDLADSLLDGTDLSGKVSTEQLLALLTSQ